MTVELSFPFFFYFNPFFERLQSRIVNQGYERKGEEQSKLSSAFSTKLALGNYCLGLDKGKSFRCRQTTRTAKETNLPDLPF